MVDVRAAVTGDLDALREIYRSASLSNDGDRDVLLANPEYLVWAPDGAVPPGTLVAVAGDRLLGFATVSPAEDGLELDDLFVDPDARRRGIASVLVAFLAMDGVRDGYAWIDVTGNPHAAAFYASAGFVRTGEVTTTFGPAPRLRLAL